MKRLRPWQQQILWEVTRLHAVSFRMEISDGPGPVEVTMTSMTDQKVTAI